MIDFSTAELGSLAALGTLGSVCAILLRSVALNLKSLDGMRREAAELAETLRRELREHDETIFQLQALCADYRVRIGTLEAERKQLKLEIRQYQEQLKSDKPKQPDHP